MRLGLYSLLACSAASCLFLAIPAFATSVTGSSNITGSVTVTANTIQFAPNFTAVGTQTGAFLGTTGGTIGSLSGGPATGAVNLVDFATFTGGPSFTPVAFDLTFIQPGGGTASGCTGAIGVSCTPAGSPFTLIQGSNGVFAFLNFNGISYTGSSSTGSTATLAGFSTQIVFAGATVPSILQTLGTGGSESGISYSATFSSAAVPEPASVLLLGLGLIGAGLVARRRFAA